MAKTRKRTRRDRVWVVTLERTVTERAHVRVTAGDEISAGVRAELALASEEDWDNARFSEEVSESEVVGCEEE